MGSPFFSIIIPTWNRRHELERCLKSILEQDFTNYEIIVVDGASTDGTQEFLRGIKDPRISLIYDEKNLGICPARNMGACAAKGEWFIFVDSDWELMTGALSKLHGLTTSVTQSVDVIGGYSVTDENERWPSHPLPQNCFRYVEYLQWLDKCVHSGADWLSCFRKQLFEGVNWPMDQRSERQFWLQVASKSTFLVCEDILCIEYTTSANRTMNDITPESWNRKLKRSFDEARMHEEILEEFGRDLRVYAPEVYIGSINQAAMFNFRSSSRIKGLKYALRGLSIKPWSLRLWVMLITGTAGPTAMRIIYSNASLKKILSWYKSGFTRKDSL